jgi:hypothetical protein
MEVQRESFVVMMEVVECALSQTIDCRELQGEIGVSHLFPQCSSRKQAL